MSMNFCRTTTATCTYDAVSDAPTVNIINRRDVFVCTLLHHELDNMCQYT